MHTRLRNIRLRKVSCISNFILLKELFYSYKFIFNNNSIFLDFYEFMTMGGERGREERGERIRGGRRKRKKSESFRFSEFFEVVI